MVEKKRRTAAITAAQARYDKAHCTRVYMKLNTVLDADILAKLDSVPSKQGYIKDLIRSDIERSPS